MHNAMKVAKWEIKRNLKNKTFVIGLFLTPLLILGFTLVSSLFDNSNNDDLFTTVFVKDELNIFPEFQETINTYDLNWHILLTDLDETDIKVELENSENTAYIFIKNNILDKGIVPVYTSDKIDDSFFQQVQLLAEPLKSLQITQLGLTEEELAIINSKIAFEKITAKEYLSSNEQSTEVVDPMKRIVPGIFAGIILLAVVFTGMMIFQSASQEKKDKIAEIILSSLTPSELMQGKIIGYFVLGITQIVIFIIFILPLSIWKFDIPILEYLLVPELALLVGIAFLGYLLFAAIFVGIGATMDDISTAGNFQGIVMMLPFIPFIIASPVINNPNGIIAQIGSYVPFTAPGVLIMRLSMLEEWPWVEIIISLAILVVSIWLFMKLAGKIFKVGILMYGKNATPSEIWKWIRA